MNKWTAALIALLSLIMGLGAYILTQEEGLFSNQTGNQQSLTKLALTKKGLVLFPKPIPVSDAPFINEEGIAQNKSDLQGKWSLLFFGYTFCPDICPTTLAVMQQMWTKLEPEQQAKTAVVLVSVDPQRDQPEQLKTYMDYFDPEFMALTGNEASLKSLSTQLNAVYAKVPRYNDAGEEDPELGYLMDHSANIVLLNPEGQYAGFIKPPFNANHTLDIVKALHAQ